MVFKRIGLFLDGKKMCEYSITEYEKALSDAKFAYEEAKVISEIKIISIEEKKDS